MPKLYITGVGPDGRSKVVETRELVGGGPPAPAYTADGPVPTILPCTTGAQLLAGHSAPGTFSAAVFGWKPGMYTDAHRTISLDVDTVLEGSVILGLEDGEITLRKGDVVVLPGTVHTWRATEEHGLVLYSIVSAAPSAADAALPTIEPMEIVHGF